MSLEERTKVAQELAAKGGNDWEGLSPEMVNAYLHNADLVIEERGRVPIDELNPKPVYTCPRCKDQAYIGGERCSECNPMGLPAAEVHPQTVVVEDIDTSDGLTEEEKTEAIDLDAALARREAEEAEAKAKLEAEEVRKARPPKPGEYVCGKCEGKIHREKSKTGKKHWDYRR